MSHGEDARSIGLMLQYDHSVATQLELAKLAEQAGFTEIWQSEYRLARDAVTPSMAYATVTDEIQVGLGVINPWTRNPALIAQTLSTLAELAGPERVAGGLGAWWDPLATQVGVDRQQPLRAIRETVEAVRALLDGETVSYDGSVVSIDGVNLQFDHHDTEPPLTTEVYVGATGFTALEMTGEFADGVLGNYLVSPEYNSRAIQALERGAKRQDRDPAAISRSQCIVVAMDEDYDTALQHARRFVLNYYAPRPSVAEPRKESGMTQAIIDDMMNILGGWPTDDEAALRAAAESLPEDVVTNLLACGTPDDAVDQVRGYSKTDYCECPVIYPATNNVPEVIAAFGDQYV